RWTARDRRHGSGDAHRSGSRTVGRRRGARDQAPTDAGRLTESGPSGLSARAGPTRRGRRDHDEAPASVSRMDLRVAAYAVVTDDDDRVLLARWTEGRRMAWTVPGGGLEDGEDPENAVRRELLEETGFRIETTELLGIHSRVIPGSRRIHKSEVPLHTLRIV